MPKSKKIAANNPALDQQSAKRKGVEEFIATLSARSGGQEEIPDNVSEGQGRAGNTAHLRMQYWQKEIEALKQSNFASVEEAVQSIVEKALLSQSKTIDPRMREALTEVLLSDPEIVETVRNNLRIE